MSQFYQLFIFSRLLLGLIAPTHEIIDKFFFLQITAQESIDATFSAKDQVISSRIVEELAARVQIDVNIIYYLLGLLSVLVTISLVMFIAFYKSSKTTKALSSLNTTIQLQKDALEELLVKEKQLNKKLHKSNNTLEHFLSIVAHDLRSPYNVMLGYADMLVANYDDLSPDDIKNRLQSLRNKAYKNFQLTQNLLSWALMQKGMLTVVRKQCVIYNVIEDTIYIHEDAFLKKDMRVINRCPKSLTGMLDVAITTSVLSNIISNAIKYTDKGGTVILSARSISDHIVFLIEDTGKGIQKRIKKNLFNLNKVSSMPGTANEPGTGLGLILCKEMITKHKGMLRLKSKKGRGTSVLIVLSTKS